jgi:signal transduction histidine kinase
VLTEVVIVSIRLQQPWLGIQLENYHQDLFVKQIQVNSPADNKLFVDDLVKGVVWQDQYIPLNGDVLKGPLSSKDFADFHQYLDLQTKLERILVDDKKINLLLDDGEIVTLYPHQTTPWHSLELLFWGLLITNTIGLLIGVIVWLYKPYRLETTCLLIASISYFGAQSIYRLASSKELYISGHLVKNMASLEALFFYSFMCVILILIGFYPNKIISKKYLYILPSIFLVLALNYHFQWLELPLHLFILPILPSLLLASWLFYKQWHLSAGNPINRTTVLVLQLSVLLPAWLIVILHAVPMILEVNPIISTLSSRILLISMFLGWSVGIVRYRLFAIEYWWFKSLLWIVGGSLVVILDMLLIGLFHTSEVYALSLSVLITGFIYFPLRQSLLDKLLPDNYKILQDFLCYFSHAIAKANFSGEFEKIWYQALNEKFKPLNIYTNTIKDGNVLLIDNGLVLSVPNLMGTNTYLLSGKQMAARLFNKADIKNINALLAIIRLAHNASNIRENAVLAERRRIMHDLHDTVGAQLLTLTYKLSEPDNRWRVKQALTTLRDTIRLSLKKNISLLHESLADWRVEIAERTELMGVELVWLQTENLDTIECSTYQLLDLSQILRELISNALKHAVPRYIEIQVSLLELRQLSIRLSHDGQIIAPEKWRSGTGMRSIYTRLQRLNGKINLSLNTQEHTQLSINITVPISK